MISLPEAPLADKRGAHGHSHVGYCCLNKSASCSKGVLKVS